MIATPRSVPTIQLLVPSRVRVVHGCHDDSFPIAGYAVEVIRTSLRYVFNIDPDAKSLVNGFEVDRSYRLADGDVVEFVRAWGRKGAIDIFAEEVLSLNKAARRLPQLRGKKPPHPFTLARWASEGRRSRSGQIVRLETCKIGGTICTSIQALNRFFTRLDDVLPTIPPLTRSQEEMEGRAKAAMDRLRQKGRIR